MEENEICENRGTHRDQKGLCNDKTGHGCAVEYESCFTPTVTFHM